MGKTKRTVIYYVKTTDIRTNEVIYVASILFSPVHKNANTTVTGTRTKAKALWVVDYTLACILCHTVSLFIGDLYKAELVTGIKWIKTHEEDETEEK